MNSQLDFTGLFFKYFSGIKSPLSYEVRPGPFVLHDLAFTNSLVHDANIDFSAILKRKSCLRIPISRDRWELRRSKKAALLAIDSEIIIDGVQHVEYDRHRLASKSRLLDYVWFSDKYRSSKVSEFIVVLVGFDWRLRMLVGVDKWKLRVTDKA